MKCVIQAVAMLAVLASGACVTQPGDRAADSQVASSGVGSSAAIQQAATWFDLNRHRPTLLRSFLMSMPKGGDIHTHASGAVYAESYIEWAASENRCVNMGTGEISEVNFAPCNTPEIPATELLRDSERYGDLVNRLSLRYPDLTGQSGHDQFFEAFGKFAGGTRGSQIAELTNRAARQNISYAEIMLTLGKAITKQYGKEIDYNDDLESMYEQLLAAQLRARVAEGTAELDRYEEQAVALLGCRTNSPALGCRVTRRYLLQINRVVNPTRVFAQFVYAFELAQMDPKVVGLNMVAPEDNYVALRDYDLHMNMLAYLSARYPDVQVSLHAGELAFGLVPPRHLQDHIRKAVMVAGAKRIGHGVDIFYENRPHELLQAMKQRDVLVEICLTSNDYILGIKDADHPFTDYLKVGVPVTLGTDDEGISRSDLTNEYFRAVQSYGLGYQELKQLARNSLSYSFLAGASVWQSNNDAQLVDACAGNAPGSSRPGAACFAFLQSSHKARLQWQLERDFEIFERSPWLSQ